MARTARRTQKQTRPSSFLEFKTLVRTRAKFQYTSPIEAVPCSKGAGRLRPIWSNWMIYFRQRQRWFYLTSDTPDEKPYGTPDSWRSAKPTTASGSAPAARGHLAKRLQISHLGSGLPLEVFLVFNQKLVVSRERVFLYVLHAESEPSATTEGKEQASRRQRSSTDNASARLCTTSAIRDERTKQKQDRGEGKQSTNLRTSDEGRI